VIDVMTISV